MYQNQTSVRKVMTIRISRDLPLCNFERLDILCTWIEHPSETIWISRELPLFNFEHFDKLCSRIGIPFEKLWPFEFLECFYCSISSVSINYVPESDIRIKSYAISIFREILLFNFEHLNILFPKIRHPCEKLWPFKSLESFRYSISIVSIYYVPESEIRAKIHDHLNFSRASVVQFRASW